MPNLTTEQQAVIHHPTGHHARVLAVAGSGKTTTMTYRVQHLIRDEGVYPSKIGLLMFNRLAREQFQAKLLTLLPPEEQPRVNTFHSFAYHVLHAAIRDGVYPHIREKWFNENSEESRRLVLRLIQRMAYDGEIRPDSIDAEEVLRAIGLWKGALTPPDRAGYRNNRHIPELYLRFEEERQSRGAITFDDLVPLAVQLMQSQQAVKKRWLGRYQYLIIDEYQDVNLGQQRMIELLAGDQADVMVVGDDDQTIYEWRGARPGFILQDFSDRFDSKPTDNYTLSHSFRFGPLVAQCAENTVRYNEERVAKRVIAHHHQRKTRIHLLRGEPYRVNSQLADQIRAYIEAGKPLDQLIVLGRLFSQMNGLELEFLTREQPYRVEGGSPLLERNEIVKLLMYIRLASRLDDTIDQDAKQMMIATANVPNRMLRRADLSDMLTLAQRNQLSIREGLLMLSDPMITPFNIEQARRVEGYADAIRMLSDNLSAPAGEALDWLVEFVDYEGHFDDYYGYSEASEDRKRAVRALRQYAHIIDHTLTDFLTHVDELDTTHGAPLAQQVVLTSIHRVKGLEYDVVVLPDCIEGYLPCLIDEDCPVFDKAAKNKDNGVQYNIDAERRLFYVAITRAKEQLYIGTIPHADPNSLTAPQPSAFLDEMQLDLTQRMIDALQNQGWDDLERMAQRAHNIPGMLHNLGAYYLPASGQPGHAAQMLQRWERLQQSSPNPKEAAQLQQRLARLRAAAAPRDLSTLKPDSAMHRAITDYPRAYLPWNDEEDRLLGEMQAADYDLKAMSEALQRQPNAVRSRLRKHEQTQHGAV